MTAALVERLGWTLVHSLWQFAVLAVLLMLVLRILERSTPQARYLSASITLLFMVFLAGATFIAGVPVRADSRDVESQPAAVARNAPAEGLDVLPRSDFASESVATVPATPRDLPASSTEELASGPRIADRLNAWYASLTAWLTPRLPGLVAMWLVGVALLSLRPLAGWLAVRRLRTTGISPLPETVISLGQRTAYRLGITRSVRFVQSGLLQVPAAVGWLKPLVLLPAGVASGLTPQQLEAVLAHELAHVARHDYLVNLLQALVETLFFYHPAVWWVSRQMRLEREDCCDDAALTVCPDRGQYARMLLALDELRPAIPLAALSAGGGSLLARIRRIVSSNPPEMPAQSGGLISALSLTALALTLSLVVSPWATSIGAEQPADARQPIAAEADAKPTDHDDDSSTAAFGTLTGRFLVDGPVPQPADVPIYGPRSLQKASAGVPAEKVDSIPDESLLVGPDGGLANVLVYLISPNAPQESLDPAPPAAPVLRIVDRRFQPRVLAFPAPGELLIENNDSTAASVMVRGIRNALNPLLSPGGSARVSVQLEKLPVPVTDSVRPWMRATVLPHSNPFVAVTGADGSFSISGLPEGEWQFRAWHERTGYLNARDWDKGRFTVKIQGSRTNLGDIKLPVALFKKRAAEAPKKSNKPAGTYEYIAAEAATPTLAANASDPWFWPDPYSQLGHDQLSGEGWYYLRMAADETVGQDLHTTPQQRKEINELHRRYEQQQRELGKTLAAEGIDVTTRLARRKELWLEARNSAREFLTPPQHQRLEQLYLQRLSYNAFRETDLATRLELSAEQQKNVMAAIDAHLKRVADAERELGRSVQQAVGAAEDADLAARIRRLTSEKEHRGRLSHRRVWEEIREILTPQQREQFMQLRGPMAEPARAYLPLFEPRQ